MAAREVTLTFVQGDDPDAALTITRNGAPYNLTGKTITIVVKASKSTPDASALFTLTTGSGITIVSAVGGTATATFTNRFDTAGKFWYRGYVSDGGTVNAQTFARGPLIVEPA